MSTLFAVAGTVLPLVTVVAYAALAWRVRRFDEPGVRWFVVLLVVFGGFVGIALVVRWGLALLGYGAATAIHTGYSVALFCYLGATVAWFLFALEYTGRLSRTPAWLVGVLSAFLPLFLYNIPAQAGLFRPPGSVFVANLLEFGFFYHASLLGIGSYVVARTTYRYGHLSLVQGLTLIAGLVAGFAGFRLTFLTITGGGPAGQALSVLAASFLAIAGVVALAVFHLDVFDATPAAGNIGERAIARDTDDLIVVTDHRNRIIKVNEAAAEALGTTTTAPHGDPIEDLLAVPVDDLSERRSIPLQTTAGKRTFDPQVSELTDQHDRWLGYLVSLRDVTDREIREQRLEVLNRVLRHNLRNKLTVVRGRAETVADALDDPDLVGHLDRVVGTADYLVDLGEKAAEIEGLLASAGRPAEPVALAAVVEDATDRVSEAYPDATVEPGPLPDGAVPVDPDLLSVALFNLVENGIEHGGAEPWVAVSATVDRDDDYPTTVTVSDDGPGIPAHETRVLEQGAETVLEHGTGLGLWVTNWAVTELGGELTFAEREPSGTVASIRLPQTPSPPADEPPSRPTPVRRSGDGGGE